MALREFGLPVFFPLPFFGSLNLTFFPVDSVVWRGGFESVHLPTKFDIELRAIFEEMRHAVAPITSARTSVAEKAKRSFRVTSQSLSECASSAIGDDVADLTSLEPAQPEKKKRPPRKKKKKKPKEEEEKKQEPQPANGQRSEAAITRAAERNKNDKGSHVALKQEKSANGTGQKNMLPLETVVEHKKDVKSAAAAAAAFDEPKQAPASAAPIVAAPPTPAQAVAKPQPKLRVSAPAWETVNKSTSKHPVAQACKADTIPTAAIPVGGNGWKVQSASRAAPPPRRAVANAPVPGSWARQREYTEAPAVVRHRAAPQADWTKHSMPKSPPKNSIQSSALSSQDNFPSLSSARAKKSNQGSAPKGAWGKKR